ncbi:MAG: hypothetical protein ACREQW_13900 [Candidatus Binatia bacterium]
MIHETFSAGQRVEDDDLNVICLGGPAMRLPGNWMGAGCVREKRCGCGRKWPQEIQKSVAGAKLLPGGG